MYIFARGDMALFAVPDQFVVPLGPAPPPPQWVWRTRQNGNKKTERIINLIYNFYLIFNLPLAFLIIIGSC